MIIYHPKDDLYHCMFRFITVASLQNLDEFDFTRLRIYDFFFLFPHLAKDIEFPRAKGAAKVKKIAERMQEPYENLPDKKRIFSEMGDYHIQALQILLAKDIFKEVDGKLSISKAFNSLSVSKLLEGSSNKNDGFFHDLINILNQVEIAGQSGLKKRTGLMEYRYDAV
ncbi:ABC-three component system middle component 5 [Candidatus Sororendozoicomonas aggregata]|uniref:ABC-three component system middle component 5 n=1 Tax=Candidatus Sororendozoicomonas aggregata TaxID=3073239 RepID=UPI002ED2C0C7